MRLLFLTQSLVHGGAERHAVTLANRLAERGHECHFAYVKNDSTQLSRLRGIASVNCIGARKYLDLEALKRLGALVRSVQPTHVIAANEYALFYGWLATRRSSAKLVVTFHSTVPHTLKRRMQMLYYRPLFWSADWLVFVCEAQARYWRRR
ncbi:MAG TPA: glycosyltransferase family 4 protein, partial [Burkholderiales bacterium]|nr:glycosyltransferase family 4 protein [Burkholderiales bacterium]